MKIAFYLSLFVALASCSFFNNKKVELGINSSPKGADIYINKKYFGQTPMLVNIEPKDSFIILDKKGYGSVTYMADTYFGSIRTKANGKINADGVRCLLDMVSVIFSFQAYTGKCADFKVKQINILIPENFEQNSLQGSYSVFPNQPY